ncbi:MAG: N-acetylmuramoyl-L-alanine amidase [Bacteroidota bacterium]
MLQKLIDFFRRLFGGAPKTPPTTTTTPPPPPPRVDPPVDDDDDMPKADPVEAQDGSEITPDTVVVVVNEMEPVIIEEEIEKPGEGTLSTGSGTNDGAAGSSEEEEKTEPTEVGAAQPKHEARYLWCLDNGHGSKTKGKRSPKLADGRQLLEYEFNRDIVGRIIKELDKKGVKYFNVVPEVDTDNFLEGRVSRANKKKSSLPKLFVSVHANAAPAPHGKWSSPSISGIETWFFHNSKKGRKVASVFQKHLIEETGWKNRHIKSRPSKQFYVLRNTSMTAVLTENGFYNNKEECKLLLKEEIRQKIADAHVEAIMEIEKNGI